MPQIIIDLTDEDFIAIDDWYKSEGGIEKRLNDFCQAALICAESRKQERIQEAVDAYMEVGQDVINQAAVIIVAEFFARV